MFAHLRPLRTLLLRLLVVTALFLLCRVLFYAFNHTYFSDVGFGELVFILFYGIKFDLPAILIINFPFVVLSLLPFRFRESGSYKRILKILFLTTNSVALVANCIDLVYFPFTLKRMTADIFSFISTGDDFTRLLPLFIVDYWFLLPIFLIMLWLMVRYYRKAEATAPSTPNYLLRHGIIMVIALAFFTLVYRGGFQLKPISVISAGQYVDARNIPLLISTPFSIIKTFEQEGIQETNYYSEEQLRALYSPVCKGDTGVFRKLNVVFIIMESFSKEYVGSLNNTKGYTPFLDSLIRQGLVFTNAFANGKRSMEGIPACLAGIPGLGNEPYITSNYGSNTIRPTAVLLKEEGYSTSFYHGATNGSMGFDNFTRLAGFDQYFGRTEYGNEKDFDGHWGIWDEEFFRYFAGNLNKSRQPFFSVFFSLTSHHPYPVPDKYSSVFPQGELPIQKSISYSDHALREFFKIASAAPWFSNTLFVITADHTGEAYLPYYSTNAGAYRVPLLFYLPNGELKGTCKQVVQHIDIGPSILDLLNYNKDHFAFGKSVLDSLRPRYAYSFTGNTFQLLSDKYLLQFDGEKTKALYEHPTDSLLKHNIASDQPRVVEDLESKLKAFLQTYHHSLIHNKMTLGQ